MEQKLCPFGIENGLFLYDDYKLNSPIILENGIAYPSVLHALLSRKTADFEKQKQIATIELPANLKDYERSLQAVDIWNERFILASLEEITEIKFYKNPSLLKRLLDTGDIELKDTPVTGPLLLGFIDDVASIENYRGKNLMKVRSILRNKKPLG